MRCTGLRIVRCRFVACEQYTICLERLDRTEDALTAARTALTHAKESQMALACHDIGRLLSKKGEKKEALTWLDRALHYNSDHIPSLRLRIILNRFFHNSTAEFQDADRLASLNPRDAYALLTRIRTRYESVGGGKGPLGDSGEKDLQLFESLVFNDQKMDAKQFYTAGHFYRLLLNDIRERRLAETAIKLFKKAEEYGYAEKQKQINNAIGYSMIRQSLRAFHILRYSSGCMCRCVCAVMCILRMTVKMRLEKWDVWEERDQQPTRQTTPPQRSPTKRASARDDHINRRNGGERSRSPVSESERNRGVTRRSRSRSRDRIHKSRSRSPVSALASTHKKPFYANPRPTNSESTTAIPIPCTPAASAALSSSSASVAIPMSSTLTPSIADVLSKESYPQNVLDWKESDVARLIVNCGAAFERLYANWAIDNGVNGMILKDFRAWDDRDSAQKFLTTSGPFTPLHARVIANKLFDHHHKQSLPSSLSSAK